MATLHSHLCLVALLLASFPFCHRGHPRQPPVPTGPCRRPACHCVPMATLHSHLCLPVATLHSHLCLRAPSACQVYEVSLPRFGLPELARPPLRLACPPWRVGVPLPAPDISAFRPDSKSLLQRSKGYRCEINKRARACDGTSRAPLAPEVKVGMALRTSAEHAR